MSSFTQVWCNHPDNLINECIDVSTQETGNILRCGKLQIKCDDKIKVVKTNAEGGDKIIARLIFRAQCRDRNGSKFKSAHYLPIPTVFRILVVTPTPCAS